MYPEHVFTVLTHSVHRGLAVLTGRDVTSPLAGGQPKVVATRLFLTCRTLAPACAALMLAVPDGVAVAYDPRLVPARAVRRWADHQARLGRHYARLTRAEAATWR